MTNRVIILISLATGFLLAIASCKTTEENYRTAYEKAIAGRDSLTALENTIYGKHRSTTMSLITAGDDTAEMFTSRVIVTEGGGGIKENLKAYSIVVGQFKQLVNAKSLRERLVDAGYHAAFVVQNAEPYYYVLLSSYTNREDAVKACAEVSADKSFPLTLREGLPVILYCPR